MGAGMTSQDLSNEETYGKGEEYGSLQGDLTS